MRKTINIGDLGTIITGKTPPTTNKNYYGDYAVFIKPTDISEQSKYTYETEEMYSKLAAEKYESSLIPKGAICVPCIGTIGTKMTMTPCDCYTNQSINSIICNENYDNEYVYYLIKNFLPGLKAYNLGTASGREYVSKSNFEKIELVAEQDKEIQKKIGVILSRYDSLIENSQKQIKLLEEAAQRLYKEWFVDLRFPGHENTKIVDGVPEGWERKKLCEFTGITDGTHDSPKQVEIGLPLVTGRCIVDGSIDFSQAYNISEEDVININKRSAVEDGDILLSNIGTIGKVCRISKSGNYAVKNMIIFKPHDAIHSCFLHRFLTDNNTQMDFLQQAAGTSQKFVSLSFIRNTLILRPSDTILNLFYNHSEKYFNYVLSLQSQLRLLTEARDRLLPKLMSGEITV